MNDKVEIDPGGMELNLWLDKIGRERTTGYRWQELKMIEPCNILGRLYITTEEIKRFWTRARAGEFAKVPAGICGKPGPKPKDQNPDDGK